MPFSEALAERIRQNLRQRKNVAERKMFGGIGFLLNGNMCVGVWKDSLIVRIGPDGGGDRRILGAIPLRTKLAEAVEATARTTPRGPQRTVTGH